MSSAVFHEVAPDRADEFVGCGYRLRHFFPHRIRHFQKCGPDAFRIAVSACGVRDPAAHWEIVLYADDSLIEDLPRDVFFDDDVVWHQQQFGRPGQVAGASVVLERTTLVVTVLVSDLVQRISRRRDLKTRVEKRFKGWTHMLLNAVLSFALERGVETVRTPTAELAMEHTDPSRTVGPALYERIYDHAVTSLFPARRDGRWWVVEPHVDRVVRPARRAEPLPSGRRICVCHDIERGRGHLDVDREFALSVEEPARRHLDDMLAIEDADGVRATYNVLGLLLPEVRSKLEAGGHAIAFHSYDHRIDPGRRLLDRLHWLASRARGVREVDPRDARQLNKCRQLDYRIKGYRPPQSRITPELSDANLLFHNFEWVASAPGSLGVSEPRLASGLVKIPIAIDDFDLHRGEVSYDDWERQLLDLVRARDFVAICLHDCYGEHWLPRYRRLLAQLAGEGRLLTMDELAAEVTLATAA